MNKETEKSSPGKKTRNETELKRTGDLVERVSVTNQNPKELSKKNYEVIEILSSSDDDEHSTNQIDYEEINKCSHGQTKSSSLRDRMNILENSGSKNRKAEYSFTYTYQNSAYVQNLAEICYDILHDVRWRTIDAQSKLFQWEIGDDLSVLYAFSRLFIDNESMGDLQKQPNNLDEKVARCMNLYARLFYRKGPWFTLSDIFVRYYHRDYLRRQSYQKNIGNDKDFQQPEKMEKNDSNQTFEIHNTQNHMISWSWIEKCLIDCLADVNKMLSDGLLRTFKDEEECGIIVGNRNSLCTMKEKQTILRKLGGKITSSTDNSTTNKKYHIKEEDSGRQSKRQKRNRVPRTNEILKQMRSQKTIFVQSNRVLPVRRHVESVLVESLAQKIQAIVVGSLTNSNSTEIKEKSFKEVTALVQKVWDEINEQNKSRIRFPVCFRLREEPLQILRRASRLYICAGNGPGSMRYDGTNAWLTVFEQQTTPDDGVVDEAKAYVSDICTLPDSPEASFWFKVVFDGLNHRLRLTSCNFINNYRRLPFMTVQNQLVHHASVFKDLKSFLLWELCAELRNFNDYLIEWNSLVLYAQRKKNSISPQSESCANSISTLSPDSNESFDFLSKEGRFTILKRFIKNTTVHLCEINIHNEIEHEIMSLHYRDDNGDETDYFMTDAERSICSLGLICQYFLLRYFDSISSDEIAILTQRPWLRHLSWQASMAYLVWDCVEIFEKRGYHGVAHSLLQTILYGTKNQAPNNKKKNLEGYMQVLLSRRVRGKAHDRMITDMKHVTRKSKGLNQKRRSKNDNIKAKRQFDAQVRNIISIAGSLSSLPFSFLRKFSRKLKSPLSKSLESVVNMEMLELSIRLQCNQFKEWAPIVDYSIANALKNDSPASSKRCSYVGNEQTDDFGLVHYRSLNVEELAIEEYSNGNLPTIDCKSQGGGWIGWHSEGIHVRVLFRILVSQRLLQFNFLHEEGSLLHQEQDTIFLTPYQSSPLDLHVGHCMLENTESSVAVRSFYERRRIQINSFLHEISQLSPQSLADFVYECVMNRKRLSETQGRRLSNDPLCLKDVKEVRTLSLIAAGIGGELLAAMFRCLCYDYRQYSGGLADLTLVRATFGLSNSKQKDNQVDLRKWIGESFAVENPHSNKAILIDRDDEFLGGSLNDKQKSSSSSSNNSRRLLEDTDDGLVQVKPLKLVHEGKPIVVETIFVEVKSANDTLDERQEDWLNIIGGFGEARVCKFESSTTKKSKRK